MKNNFTVRQYEYKPYCDVFTFHKEYSDESLFLSCSNNGLKMALNIRRHFKQWRVFISSSVESTAGAISNVHVVCFQAEKTKTATSPALSSREAHTDPHFIVCVYSHLFSRLVWE